MSNFNEDENLVKDICSSIKEEDWFKSLSFPLEIYRGFKQRKENLNKKDLGLSWTTDFDIAAEAAGENGTIAIAKIFENGINKEETLERNKAFELMEHEIVPKNTSFLKNIKFRQN